MNDYSDPDVPHVLHLNVEAASVLPGPCPSCEELTLARAAVVTDDGHHVGVITFCYTCGETTK